MVAYASVSAKATQCVCHGRFLKALYDSCMTANGVHRDATRIAMSGTRRRVRPRSLTPSQSGAETITTTVLQCRSAHSLQSRRMEDHGKHNLVVVR
jgi:hypothetical protein